eukprot:363865-Chlamydomonas_euryale.AAC.23
MSSPFITCLMLSIVPSISGRPLSLLELSDTRTPRAKYARQRYWSQTSTACGPLPPDAGRRAGRHTGMNAAQRACTPRLITDIFISSKYISRHLLAMSRDTAAPSKDAAVCQLAPWHLCMLYGTHLESSLCTDHQRLKPHTLRALAGQAACNGIVRFLQRLCVASACRLLERAEDDSGERHGTPAMPRLARISERRTRSSLPVTANS